jgi:putative ABC transport system permease protein
MDSFLLDVRFAWRSLAKARATTAIAILCLALGIGANTAIFSVVRAVLLQSLPYRDPSRLVKLYETYTSRGEQHTGSVAPPNFLEWGRQRQIFDDVAAYQVSFRDLGDAGDPERLRGLRVTPNLFDVLGVKPALGRAFQAADAEPGAPAMVILSDGLWRRRFGADPAVLGSQITLSGVKHTVVAIMPSRFAFPIATTPTSIWIPLRWPDIGGATSRSNHSLEVIARLTNGVDSARAAADLRVLSGRLAQEFPSAQNGRGVLLMSLSGNIVGKIRPALLVLLGAVGLVLLIACANVANLTLARAAGRRREIAVRTALGAERARIVRQLLTESTLLALIGGALGLLVAWGALQLLLALAASILPRTDEIGLEAPVLLFTTLLALLTGIGVGIMPALQTSRVDLRPDLSDGAGKSTGGAARQRSLNVLAAAEIALSLVLLVGAGLMIRSFVALLDTGTGFRSDHVLVFHASAPSGVTVADSLRYTQFYGPVLERLRATPGVRSAGIISTLPIQDGATDRYFTIVGRPVDSTSGHRPDAQMRVVSGGYFRSLGIPVLAGRDVDDRDMAASEHIAIVNDELVRQYFPGEAPIGKQIDMGTGPLTIVGVVKSVRQIGLDQRALAEFYLPATQERYNTNAMAFVVATSGPPETLARAAREAVHSVAPRQPIYQIETMDDVIATSLASRRLLLTLLGTFASLALALSMAGVYGVMTYGVSQRTREIGIRMALGARALDVTTMVLLAAAKTTAVGIAFGLLGATVLVGALRVMLYGVGAHDPLTFVVAPVIIAIIALGAGAVPAIRAARIDPLGAMRAE